jgi:hypothetical protein
VISLVTQSGWVRSTPHIAAPGEGSPLRRRRSVAGAGQRRLSRTGPSDAGIEEWAPEPSLRT